MEKNKKCAVKGGLGPCHDWASGPQPCLAGLGAMTWQAQVQAGSPCLRAWLYKGYGVPRLPGRMYSCPGRGPGPYELTTPPSLTHMYVHARIVPNVVGGGDRTHACTWETRCCGQPIYKCTCMHTHKNTLTGGGMADYLPPSYALAAP